MSTDHSYEVHRAVVHSVGADGRVFVRVPALYGSNLVAVEAVSTELTGYTNPSAGDIRLVAVSGDKTHAQWMFGPDVRGLVDRLDELESRVEVLEGYHA